MCENATYLCRLCLKTSEFCFSLFTGNILHKIESLASIKITRDDKLPQTCCEACVAHVYSSYKFQQCIRESDKTLREKLMHTETHIIEHAKQAPDLFEILHLDGTPDGNDPEVLEIEPKIENIEFNDGNDFAEYDSKSESAFEECKTASGTVDNQIIKNLLQSSDCLGDAAVDLNDKNDVVFDDENFTDTLKTLEAEDVDGVYSKLNIEHELELTDEIRSTPDFLEFSERIDKSYKKPYVKEKPKKKLEFCKKKQKINTSAVGEVLTKLGTQNKFDQKVPAYCEKKKGNQVTWECKECETSFDTKRMLQRHMLKHKIDKCPFCFVTMRSDNLKRHIQIHTDTPEVCEICGKIAKNKESLRGHVNYQHKNTRLVKCETCNREFRSNYHYTAHVRKIHLGIRNHQCHICGKKFFANHDLKKHINMTHRGARPYICQYCKKGFSSPYARKTHIRQHTLETPYRCEVCAAGFRQKVSLITHLKSKHSIVNKKTDNSELK